MRTTTLSRHQSPVPRTSATATARLAEICRCRFWRLSRCTRRSRRTPCMHWHSKAGPCRSRRGSSLRPLTCRANCCRSFLRGCSRKRSSKVSKSAGAAARKSESSHFGDRIALGEARETTVGLAEKHHVGLERLPEDRQSRRTHARHDRVEGGFSPQPWSSRCGGARCREPRANGVLPATAMLVGRRKKHRSQVHFIDEPSRLFRLGTMAPCRVQLSGKRHTVPSVSGTIRSRRRCRWHAAKHPVGR